MLCSAASSERRAVMPGASMMMVAGETAPGAKPSESCS
jgi:hypothetical protein